MRLGSEEKRTCAALASVNALALKPGTLKSHKRPSMRSRGRRATFVAELQDELITLRRIELVRPRELIEPLQQQSALLTSLKGH